MTKKQPSSRPFPWKCGYCRERAVKPAVSAYATEAEHDGRTYTVSVSDLKAPRCEKCGELVLDGSANRQISDALRRQIQLLSSEQIRQNREALGLTQKQLASQLRIAEATLSRWESGGQIQQRALDTLLRLYFSFADVRSVLTDENRLANLGAEIRSTPHAAVMRGSPGDEPTAQIARLATKLQGLPSKKKDAVLDEFSRLVDLMKK